MKVENSHFDIGHFDMQPQEIQLEIFNYLPTETRRISRVVCRAWRDLMPSGSYTVEHLCLWAINTGNISVCRLVNRWGFKDFDQMLTTAAFCGQEAICRFAKECGATNYNEMFRGAYYGGHSSIARIAEVWRKDKNTPTFIQH